MIICTNCNTENDDNSKFCINCGAKLVVETGRRGPRPVSNRNTTELGGYAQGKTPLVACVLSLLIIGLGQFYNRDMKKGGMMLVGGALVGAITGGILWFVIAVYSAFDAYQVAEGKKQLGQW